MEGFWYQANKVRENVTQYFFSHRMSFWKTLKQFNKQLQGETKVYREEEYGDKAIFHEHLIGGGENQDENKYYLLFLVKRLNPRLKKRDMKSEAY